MKNKKSFFAALVMMPLAVMAQTTTVKGILMDKSINQCESFSTVRVFTQNDTLKPVSMFLTDEDGRFSENVKGSGKYRIVFSSVGKDDLKLDIVLGQRDTLDLGTLFMSPSATMLSGVEVVAQKPLVKMEADKMSYNVSEDADAKAATVLDILRKVPLVSVDGQDNISVNGSQSFKVYVDGKPNVMFSSNPAMVFKSMPATAVKTIEVITNPGAKYDAEGVGGVLNIMMNKQDVHAQASLDGYNGTLRLSAGNKSLGGGAFVSGQQGRLSYSANVMEYYSTPGTTEMTTEQTIGQGITISLSNSKTKIPFTMASASFGYELDSLSSLNATASLTRLYMKNDGQPTTLMSGGTYGSGFSYGTDMQMRNTKTSFSGSVDYQRFFNPEHTRSLVLTYQLNYNPSKNEQRNDFNHSSTDFVDLTDRYSLSKERTIDHTWQVDFSTPLTTGQTLSLGTKLLMRRASSDAKYYLNDVYSEQLSMDYLYKNTILAGYAEYAGTWNQFGLKGGLRYEHTWQDVDFRLGNGSDFTKNYGSLVPTASLSHTLTPTSNLGLNYSMRISRPGITYLNPYVNRSDPTSLTYGNTSLDVEKSHNTALVYNLFTPSFMMNLNLHANFTTDGIEQYSFYEQQKQYTTYGNIVSRSQTGLSAYVNWLMAKNTRIFFNGGLDYVALHSDALDTQSNGWQANAMMGLQQTLPWNLKLSAYLMSSSKSYTLQGWSSGFNMLTATLSKSFFNDKLNLSLMGLMGLSSGGNLKIETCSTGKNFSSHSLIKVPLNGFTFSVSYTFGNTKRQAKQHVSRVQNDYIEQKSQGEIINSAGMQQK